MKKLILIAALAASFSAQAEFFDGNALSRSFENNDYFSEGFTLGYVTGVADASKGISVCVVQGVTSGQMQAIVKKWVVENPALRHYSGDVVVRLALMEVFPCPKKAPAKGTTL